MSFPIFPYAMVKETHPSSMSDDAAISAWIIQTADLQRRAANGGYVENTMISLMGQVLSEFKQVQVARTHPELLGGWIIPSEVA